MEENTFPRTPILFWGGVVFCFDPEYNSYFLQGWTDGTFNISSKVWDHPQ